MTRMEFDTITVTNPNGTISEYTNSYPFLLQSGVFDILKENFSFGDQNSDGLGTQKSDFTGMYLNTVEPIWVELSYVWTILLKRGSHCKNGGKMLFLGKWLNG